MFLKNKGRGGRTREGGSDATARVREVIIPGVRCVMCCSQQSWVIESGRSTRIIRGRFRC